jgi:tetratricopeptide (TPR) repeat protein
MNEQNPIEQYLQTLRAMGMSEEAIAMYRKQMEASINLTNQWASQFGRNMDQMNINQAFGAFGNEDEQTELPLNPDSTLTTRQQWAIACGADLAMLNGQYLNDLTTGFQKQECRQLLSQWWDIDSKEELLDMIQWLFNEGHRIQYDLIWQALNTVSMKESKEFLRQHVASNEEEAELALKRLRNMRDALELFREHELIGPGFQPEMLIWDYARVINLSRGAFDAGYISREEALEIIDQCIDPIRNMYSSWKQLSVSYQFARYVWSDLEEEDCMEMMENMETLLKDPESPWVKLKWDEPI